MNGPYFILIVLVCAALNAKGQTEERTGNLGKSFLQAKHQFAEFEKTHGHFVQTPNVRMHYLTWGNPTDMPLIWCHGSLTNGYEWLNIADSISEKEFYVIAIDYYGHGQTAIPPKDVSLYHVADDISCLMDSLGIKKAVVGGWSRGGFIATAFYDAYPERVLGLILADGGSVSTNTHYHQLKDSELEKRLQQIDAEMPKDTSYGSQMEAYTAIYDHQAKGSQFELLAWITPMANQRWAICPGVLSLFNMQNSRQWRNNIQRSTAVPLFAESMSILEPKIIYRNLHVPMLILDPVEDNDPFPFTKENQALARKHPSFIKHIVYESTGHNMHGAKPQKFIQDIKDFLQSVRNIL